MKARVCLNMIVKNEAAILERCLAAAAPHIDCYAICDTGSTDSTVEIIRRFFDARRIPGVICETTFRNFEQARNEALDAARASTLQFDYLLLCDADMELVVRRPLYREELTADAYYLSQSMVSGPLEYSNIRLVRGSIPARYRGVTHEHLDVGQAKTESFDGASFLDHAAGSSRAVKFERDIQLLLDGLKAEPDNARYVFYLAQSYRDSDQAAKSRETYQRRFQMGGWEEEVWYSLYQTAVLGERLKMDDATVVHEYLAAYQLRPQRSEPLYQLARYYREQGQRHALAHMVSERGMAIARPSDRLFVETQVYDWRLADEYSIACYWTGRYDVCARICESLLANPTVPAEHRSRVTANLDFARKHLAS